MIVFTLLPTQKGEDLRITISGTIYCQEGRKANIPLGGATLSLISGRDTLNTVSDNSGKFSFSIPQAFEVIIIAKYQGFDDYHEVYQLFGDHTAIAIKMNQSREQLDAAKIESEIPFVRKEADTTIYNMAALEKMEGDRALDLLLQIPGFGINKGKLTVWGEYVDKTYVNGKLIYGDDPMSALSLLKAEEIKNVRVYDTQYLADKHRGVKNSKKRRVIDVQTFKQFLSAVDLQAQARVGTIYTQKDQGDESTLRFSSGFDFDSNREMQQVGVYFNGNNINDDQNGIEVVKNAPPTLFSDTRYFDAKGTFVKKWKDSEWGNSLSLDYSYNHESEKRHSETIIDRTETDGGLVPLHYEERCSAWDRKGLHVASVGVELHQSPLKDIDFYAGVAFNNSRTGEAETLSSTTGSADNLRQDQVSGTRDRGFSIGQDFTWSNLDAKNGWTPSVGFSCDLSNNLAYSYTIDTLKSSTTRRYLEGNGGGASKHLSGFFSLKKTLSDTGLLTTELEMTCRADYSNEHKRIMTVDYLLPEGDQTDFANSFNYHWNDLKFSAGAGFTIASPIAQILAISVGVVSDRQLDDEAFPESIRTTNSFTLPYARVSITPPLRENRLYLSYSLSGDIPALEQTRERVDNSNPLRLLIGNPELKAQLNHSFGISYYPYISDEGSSFAFQSRFKFNQKPIVDKIQYYSKSAILNAWGVDYEIPAGGTLTGYENANLAFSFFCSGSYGRRIKPLKGTFKSEIRFDLHKSPEYDGDYLNHVTGFGPKMSLSFSTMPVKFMRVTLFNGTTYTKDINTSGTVLSELILESCSVSGEVRFLKHAFFQAEYSASIYKYLSGMGVNTDIQNLNCALGILFFDSNLAVSISGSDLLGKALNYSTRSTSSELVRQSGYSLGNYCLLNIAYRFGKKE